MIDVPHGQLNVVADGPDDGRPVVLIHAGIEEPSNMSPGFASRSSLWPDQGTPLVVIPDVAHMIGMEVPEQLAKLITEFLLDV
jgi:pimeloyl-ACP methyl ester carboxylesterase